MHYVSNGAGWLLALKRTYDENYLDPNLKPLVIVPGYCMNSFILGYHPWDFSMEEYLASQGLEVWSINLRNQDLSQRQGGSDEYDIEDVVFEDLPAVIRYVRENTFSKREQIDLCGASLGGTYVYSYAALVDDQGIGSLVGLGAPFRMLGMHPAISVFFSCPELLGAVNIKHTRRLAELAFPVALKFPWLVSIYMHPEIVDTTEYRQMVKTVEDPNRKLNKQLARWIKDKDLIVDGKNLTMEMSKVENPIFCLLSNADGIVAPENAMSVLDAASSKVKDYLVAGNENIKMAHADLFISDYCRSMVFEPLANWLLKHN